MSSLTERFITRILGPGPAPEPQLPAVRADAQVSPGMVGAVNQLRDRLDSIRNTLTGMGGTNDKGVASRPDIFQSRLTDTENAVVYEFNGYGKRLAEIVPSDATRKGWRIEDGTDEPDPMAEEDKRLQVQARIKSAMTWARVYGGSLVLMITEGDDQMEQPLNLARVRRLTNLIVLDKGEFSPAKFEGDPNDPRYREPSHWSISPSSVGGSTIGSGGSGGTNVHHSRVLYFPGAVLSPSRRYQNGDGCDDSIFQGVWDQLRNKTAVEHGGAIMAQELKIDVLKIKGLQGLSTGDQAATTMTRMQLIAKSKSLLNLVLIGDGDEYETRTFSTTGFKDLDESTRIALSAVTGIPQVILFGETPGGLNTDGESHRAIWGNAIAAVQQEIIAPELVRFYEVVYAQKDGPFTGQQPEIWDVKFNKLAELTDKQDAEVKKLHAEADVARVQNMILPPEHIAKSRWPASGVGYQADLLPFDPGEFEDEPVPAAEEAAFIAGGGEAGGEIGAPAASEGEKTGAEALNKLRLNGAQIASALDIVARVAAGELKAKQGKEMLQTFLQVPPEAAEAMVRKDGLRQLRGWMVRQDGDVFTSDSETTMISLALSEQGRRQWLEALHVVQVKLGQVLGPPAFPHVTLLFLGEIKPEDLAPISEILGKLLEEQGPIDLHVEGVQIFGSSDLTGGETILSLKVGSWWDLETLNGKLLRALAPFVEASQPVEFRPHITLGALKRPLTPEEISSLGEMEAGCGSSVAAEVELWAFGERAGSYPLNPDPDPRRDGEGETE